MKRAMSAAWQTCRTRAFISRIADSWQRDTSCRTNGVPHAHTHIYVYPQPSYLPLRAHIFVCMLIFVHVCVCVYVYECLCSLAGLAAGVAISKLLRVAYK